MLAVLQISQLTTGLTHLACGPWGCGPPLEALAACHGFWALFLTPPAAWAASRSSMAAVRLVSLCAGLAGLAGVIGVVAWQAGTYLPLVGEGQPSYFFQRCLFVIATTVELPMVQLILLGLAGWWYAIRRRKQFVAAQLKTLVYPTDDHAGEYAVPASRTTSHSETMN